ncbi:MAG: DUF4160 domain-containing protein [Clostridia bacterium]|nr:DUF4160 domain-containing protein [Clostridia bacterium]
MVQISWFYGIKISMYYDEHLPPHFHAEYGDHHAIVDIQRAVIIRGYLPKKQASLVIAWTLLHQDELMDNWHNAYNHKELFKIDPLR